jgi:hypothetical protein
MSAFENAKKRGAQAGDDLLAVARGKRTAAGRDPGADRFAETARHVKAKGDAPWTRTADDVFGANTSASSKRTT